jgi:DNA-binding transcriptional LysR family regulator
MAVGGCGIAPGLQRFAEPLVKTGQLRRLLPDWSLPEDDAWAVYAGRKLLPAKTRAFIAMLQAALGP